MRGIVTATTPAGPKPMRSSTSPQTACPATTPTVNSETPMIPTASPCVATVRAPAAPPASIHQGMPPDRMPAISVANPRRPAGSTSGERDEDEQPRGEGDRRGDQPVVEAKAELAVDARLDGGEDTHQDCTAERDPGGHVAAGHSPIMREHRAFFGVGGRGYAGVWPSPLAPARC